MKDIAGRPVVYRYPTIATMPETLIGVYLQAECECREDLPDGRSFELCLPCKVQQDYRRWQEDQVYAMGHIGQDEVDIPFRF